MTATSAHCCRRIAGCGHVFDGAALWDRHRRRGRCLDPRSLDLIRTTDGTWLRALEYSSKPGEHVLDLFGGSGSTLIAAERTGRCAYLMELDPPYCDVIVQRYEQFSGKSAQRAA